MDFFRSYFFNDKPLISFPFLLSELDSPVIKTLERHSLNVKMIFFKKKMLIKFLEFGKTKTTYLVDTLKSFHKGRVLEGI